MKCIIKYKNPQYANEKKPLCQYEDHAVLFQNFQRKKKIAVKKNVKEQEKNNTARERSNTSRVKKKKKIRYNKPVELVNYKQMFSLKYKILGIIHKNLYEYKIKDDQII